MNSDLIILVVVPAVLVGMVVLFVSSTSVVIRRHFAIRQYGELPKPEVLASLDSRMSLKEIEDLLKPDLLQIDKGIYLWQREVPGHGLWLVKVENIDGFLSWTVSFESTESIYLTYSYGCLKP